MAIEAASIFPQPDISTESTKLTVQSENVSISGRLVEFSLAVAASMLVATLLWYFFVRPRKKSSSNIVITTTFPWLLVVVTEILYAGLSLLAGMFAFAIFFADHQPYPGPLGNIRFLVAVEVVVMLALHVVALRWLQNRHVQWGLRPVMQHVMLVLNILIVGLTIIPLMLTLLFGD